MIHLIPCKTGMPKGEVSERIASGWVLAGRQAINVGQDLVVPGMQIQPGTGVVDVDVWVLPEPTMPQRAVSQAILSVAEVPEHRPALDSLLGLLFNVSLTQLEELASQAQEKQDEVAS